MDRRNDLTEDGVFSQGNQNNIFVPLTLHERTISKRVGGPSRESDAFQKILLRPEIPWEKKPGGESEAFVEYMKAHCQRCGKTLYPWSRFGDLCKDCHEDLRMEFDIGIPLAKYKQSNIHYVLDKVENTTDLDFLISSI